MTIPLLTRRSRTLFVVLLMAPLLKARGQDSTRTGKSECAASAAALRKGAAEHAAWHSAAHCGIEGTAALGDALLGMIHEKREAPLVRAEAALRDIVDGTLFDVERRVAAMPTASDPVRAMALRLLLAQHDNATMLIEVSGARPCRTATLSIAPAEIVTPLPPDYLGLAAGTAKRVALDPASPVATRATARCLVTLFAPLLSPDVQASRLEFSYVCGRRFRVRNRNPGWAAVTYAVDGTDVHGDYNVRPDGDTTFVAGAVGTTSLYLNPEHAAPLGVLVRRIPNSGLPCP